MAMNNRRMTPTQEPGVLDFAPGAAAAYSLRNLSLSYTGPVVTVRRSTDNAEADFTASEVSDGTLAGWAGADGFVKTWWDQSGNARHATQATTTAQPQIVDSGVLVTEGGKAAVRFDGVDDYMLASALVEDQPTWFFVVGKRDSVAGKQNYFDGENAGGRNEVFLLPATGYISIQAGAILSSAVEGDTDAEHLSIMFNATASAIYRNGALIALGDAGTKGIDGLVIGADNDQSDILDGVVMELIAYSTDQSALRTRIEGNLAWHY